MKTFERELFASKIFQSTVNQFVTTSSMIGCYQTLSRQQVSLTSLVNLAVYQITHPKIGVDDCLRPGKFEKHLLVFIDRTIEDGSSEPLPASTPIPQLHIIPNLIPILLLPPVGLCLWLVASVKLFHFYHKLTPIRVGFLSTKIDQVRYNKNTIRLRLYASRFTYMNQTNQITKHPGGLKKVKKYDSNKRILVTGGAGFLGSNLCERLINEGCNVLCVDNFYTGSKRNILHLLKNPYFELLRHDITFPLYVEVDDIYNLACPASPIHYQNDPVQTTKVNVHGSINILGLAKRLKAKILQSSTSEVYGNPTVHPQPETYCGSVNSGGPRDGSVEWMNCSGTRLSN